MLLWDVFKKASSPALMVYLGKTAELVAGFLLVTGLFTRIACVIIIGTFIYIPFFVGSGKIWYEDQYPFLFALFLEARVNIVLITYYLIKNSKIKAFQKNATHERSRCKSFFIPDEKTDRISFLFIKHNS